MQKLIRRKEGIQRIQVGLTGLVGVLMLVGLANIVVDNVRTKEEGGLEIIPDNGTNSASVTASNPDSKPKEPLAELGVTPAADGGGVVADLQPDPNLRQPMDRPPPVTQTVPSGQ